MPTTGDFVDRPTTSDPPEPSPAIHQGHHIGQAKDAIAKTVAIEIASTGISVPELAARYQVNTDTIKRWIKHAELKGYFEEHTVKLARDLAPMAIAQLQAALSNPARPNVKAALGVLAAVDKQHERHERVQQQDKREQTLESLVDELRARRAEQAAVAKGGVSDDRQPSGSQGGWVDAEVEASAGPEAGQGVVDGGHSERPRPSDGLPGGEQ